MSIAVNYQMNDLDKNTPEFLRIKKNSDHTLSPKTSAGIEQTSELVAGPLVGEA